MMDSLSSAVQGVVVQPVEGFDREGGVGFAKGVAKGVAGYALCILCSRYDDSLQRQSVRKTRSRGNGLVFHYRRRC
jgi:hypothetical protein